MSGRAQPHGWQRWLRIAGTLVSSALFIWLLSRQDWVTVWNHLRMLSGWLIVLVVALYFSGQLFNALRWHILLRAQKAEIAFGETAKIVFAGAFVSNFLPSTIGGDTVRIVSARRFTGGWVVSAASVVVDRLLNVLSMATVIPLSLITFWPEVGRWLAGAGKSGLGMQFIFGKLKARRIWNRSFEQLGGALRLWREQPGQLGLAFAVSWLSILVIFLAVWQIARGLHIPVALYQVMGINAITYLLTLLPISVNGYGVREIAMMSLYTQIGASLEQAAALSLITRFFMLLDTLPGGLWLSQIQRGEAQGEETLEPRIDDGPPAV